MDREGKLRDLLADHEAAVNEFVRLANALPESAWLVPRAEGKWTPAQETRHLILAYGAFTGELAGEQRMQKRGSAARRLVWRAVGLTSILWRGKIPAAVRAPREARPEWEETPREPLLMEFRRHTQSFDEAFANAWRNHPGRRITHPFFGGLNLSQAIRLSSVHTRHHAAFLRRPTSP